MDKKPFDYLSYIISPASEREMIVEMVRSACEFLESYSKGEMRYYYHSFCFKGEQPAHIRPSAGDKMVLRKIMEDLVLLIPLNMRCRRNAEIFAHRALFDYYYPLYGQFNRNNDT